MVIEILSQDEIYEIGEGLFEGYVRPFASKSDSDAALLAKLNPPKDDIENGVVLINCPSHLMDYMGLRIGEDAFIVCVQDYQDARRYALEMAGAEQKWLGIP